MHIILRIIHCRYQFFFFISVPFFFPSQNLSISFSRSWILSYYKRHVFPTKVYGNLLGICDAPARLYTAVPRSDASCMDHSVAIECCIANGKYFILPGHAHVYKVLYKKTVTEEKWILLSFLITSVLNVFFSFHLLILQRSLLKEIEDRASWNINVRTFSDTSYYRFFFIEKFLESIIMKILL